MLLHRPPVFLHYSENCYYMHLFPRTLFIVHLRCNNLALIEYDAVSVKLHLRDGRTDCRSVRPFVRLFVRCLPCASILWRNEPRCFI